MDKDRIREHFLRLTEVDSVSFGEREMADILARELMDLGFDVIEDNAGELIGSDTGNLYAFLKGNDCRMKPTLFSAHMDTVVPGIGKKPVVDEEKGIITSSGDTVLGSDDVAGIVEIIEAVHSVIENCRPHGDIEVIFTVAEEVYGKGSSVFYYDQLESETAFVIDLSGGIGRAAVAAPTIISFDFEIKGKPAHAGFDPSAGINAIAVATEIVAKTRQGLIGDELTLNIGTITGGSATNIVSEYCKCEGEVRGQDHKAACRALETLRRRVERISKAAGAECEFRSEVNIRAYRTPETDDACVTFAKACGKMGLEPEFVTTRGGSDNNVFAQNGIKGIVVGCGMQNTHTTSEYIRLEDLYAGTKLIEKIISLR